MKNRLLLLFNLSFIFLASYGAPVNVTLKVIDQTKGQITNNVNDNNETNIFTWLDDGLRELNPSKSPTEWWWPMYNDPEYTTYTNGLLIKTENAWEWTLPLQVNPGTYEWNPHAKTLGWDAIRNGMYYYEGDNEDGNLVFTVAADGTITGSTELIIPDNNNAEKFPVTLQVVDYSKGELSDAPGTWAEDANIIAWVSGDLNDSEYWFYGFFDTTVENWDGAAGNEVSFPNGKLIKDNDKWIWQATFQAAPGTYEWNPMSILHGWASLNGYGGASWAGENMSFTVNASGEVSGDYFVNLGYGETANVTFQVDMTGVNVSPEGVYVK
ncbi:MAG: hypothetical protein LUG18_02845 [Candidatus Azobacteroides sp.]|nr:hypothetical protein [Candidatus Azobacteroides sp.]